MYSFAFEMLELLFFLDNFVNDIKEILEKKLADFLVMSYIKVALSKYSRNKLLIDITNLKRRPFTLDLL